MNVLELEAEVAYRQRQCRRSSDAARRHTFAVGKISRARSGVIVWILSLVGCRS